MDKTEIAKIQAFMRKTFGNDKIRIVPRPKKADSAEMFVGEEFVGVIFLDDEEGDRSFNFQMAILAEDLQG